MMNGQPSAIVDNSGQEANIQRPTFKEWRRIAPLSSSLNVGRSTLSVGRLLANPLRPLQPWRKASFLVSQAPVRHWADSPCSELG
jgi:hypothetical protein